MRAPSVALASFAFLLSACGSGETPMPEESTSNSGDVVANTIVNADRDSDGVISTEEMESYGKSIFAAMDSDDNGAVERSEFFAFQFGFSAAAEADAWAPQFQTAKAILFAIKDRDGDGAIDAAEQTVSSQSDFARADLNGDDQLSGDEAASAHLPAVIFGAAKTSATVGTQE